MPARRRPSADQLQGFVYLLTWVIAALLFLSSFAGLVYGPSGYYDPDSVMLPALVGQDAVALLLGVPLLLVSAWFGRRGSVRGLIFWMGALFYVAYLYYFNLLGVRLNLMFLGYVAVVSMSMYGALALLFALDLEEVKRTFEDAPITSVSVYLIGTSLLFAAMWAGMTISVFEAGHDLDQVLRLVIAIDGVVLLPLMFFAGLWLWRREPLGYALAGLLLVKTTATFLTLVATTLVTLHSGQTVDPLQSVAYTAGVMVAGTLLALYMQPARLVERG